MGEIVFRYFLKKEDPQIIYDLCKSTGFFRQDELEMAKELADEYLQKGGESSGYIFLMAELDGRPVGYLCYGEIPLTVGCYDLYWMAVDNSLRRQSIGSKIMAECERDLIRRGARHIYIETSDNEQYHTTRAFYIKFNYEPFATFPDFYSVGDGKAIFRKVLK